MRSFHLTSRLWKDVDINLMDLCESEAPQQAQILLDNKTQDLARKEILSPTYIGYMEIPPLYAHLILT